MSKDSFTKPAGLQRKTKDSIGQLSLYSNPANDFKTKMALYSICYRNEVVSFYVKRHKDGLRVVNAFAFQSIFQSAQYVCIILQCSWPVLFIQTEF